MRAGGQSFEFQFLNTFGRNLSSAVVDYSPIQVQVGALAHGGEFIADIIEAGPEIPKKKVFIRDVVPGERVEAAIVAEEKNLFRADLLRIIEPSPDRTAAPCPHFGICGGCDLQHMRIAAQREAKRVMVERTLQFQGKIQPRRGVALIGKELPEFHYRRRISLHLNAGGDLGFYRAGSGDVVDIERCLLADEKLNAAMSDIRPFVLSMSREIGAITIEEWSGEIFYLLKLREKAGFPFPAWNQVHVQFANIVVERDNRVIFSQRHFGEEDIPSYPTGHFSQINAAGNKVLVDSVCDLVCHGEVTELYAGSGNFSIPLAAKSLNVTAVEADEALVLLGRSRAEEAQLSHQLTFVHATCERYLKRNSLTSTILVDPPRSGMKELLPFFKSPQVNSIVYVSCSLPTLTRDLRALSELGYAVDEVKVLDMFAQTHHVEVLTTLVRPSSRDS